MNFCDMIDKKLQKFIAPPAKVRIQKKSPEEEICARLKQAAESCESARMRDHPWVESRDGMMRLCLCQQIEKSKIESERISN